MRVIAGKAKSMPLKTIKSDNTRPTADRIKETLFNILMPYIPNATFLDLFAGSGAIGIEALSRGVKECVFVERSKEACDIIRANLEFTRLTQGTRVLQRDVSDALSQLGSFGRFDIIFMDPPYGKGLGLDLLKVIDTVEISDKDTLVVLEDDLHDSVSEGDIFSNFKVTRIKNYKTNRHIFFRRCI